MHHARTRWDELAIFFREINANVQWDQQQQNKP
jgi:hypothetical protein